VLSSGGKETAAGAERPLAAGSRREHEGADGAEDAVSGEIRGEEDGGHESPSEGFPGARLKGPVGSNRSFWEGGKRPGAGSEIAKGGFVL
jgi:hypothetical protein